MWPAILRDARDGHRGLVRFAAACVPFALLSAVAGLVDDRLIAGAPAWNKPFKFFVSVSIYALTFAWYLGQLRKASGQVPRGSAWVGTGVWVALAVELVLISMQAARGVTSHFNVATPLDMAVFNVMGVMILTLSVLHAVLWVWLLRARGADRPRLSALRWGAGVTIVGLAVGGLMVRPTADQVSRIRTGAGWVSGAHAVGVDDGGPGLPLVNWSSEGGDRRVPHFVGMHAMQAVPAVMLLVPVAWPQAMRLLAVRATGLAWSALLFVLILQAQQARPLLRPGSSLGLALALIIIGWTAAMVAAARSARRLDSLASSR
jgi:hypothetical protein